MAQTPIIDYYRLLKVPTKANNEQIRLAYIRLAKQQHPDRGGNVQQMRLLNQAYETLRNHDKRTDYDLRLIDSQSNPGNNADSFDLDEVDVFLREVFTQDKRRKWLNPLIMGLSFAGLTLIIFVVIAVGRMVTSSSSSTSVQAATPLKVSK